MVSQDGPAASVNGRRRLAWLTLLGAPAALAGGVYALTGYGIPCPFLAMTGWLCPLCGGSRMGAALLVGDFASAWVWNPLLVVVVTVLGLVWVWTAVCLMARRPAALPGPLARLDRVTLAAWVWLFAIPAVVFGIVRNVV